MNRSIMIVICDFIVLSMLSIFVVNSGGYSADGFTHGDRRTLEIVREELKVREADLLAKREKLLQIAPESEELTRLRGELADLRQKLHHIDYKLALDLAVAGELTESAIREELVAESHAKSLLQGQYEETARQLAQLEKTLAENSAKGAREIAEREREIATAKKDIGALQNELLADRGAMAQLNRRIGIRESELEATKRELASLQQVLKKAVIDLAAARSELEIIKKSHDSGASLTTDVLVLESNDVVADASANVTTLVRVSNLEWRKLECDIREKGWLFDRDHHSETTLAAISILGEEYLIGAVAAIFGNDLNFDKISRLSFGIYDPSFGDGALYNEQIYFIGSDLMLFRNPLPGGRVMSVIGISEFRTRSEAAFLRRAGQNEAVSLAGRLNFDPDGTLSVDNRKVDSDKRAQLGDFITVDGKFAGVVIYDSGKSARCASFADRLELLPVAASKVDRNGYFAEFSAAMKKLKK